MKAVVIDRFVDSYDEVKVSDVSRPEPQNGEILVQVKAAGVNFVDTLYARGKHQNNRRHVKPPFTLGLEFSGVVVSVSSPSATALFKPGDRVFGDHSGTYAEYIIIPPSSVPLLHRIPNGWSFASAAGLAATFPVSYGALRLLSNGPQSTNRLNFRSGTTVLVHAAAGGLSLAAVQIARAAGCRVLGTAGSETKCRVAERFGAEVCVNYNDKEATKPWWERILDLTDGQGVNVVYDTVGLVDRSLKCLAHRGTILVVGFAGRDGDNMEGIKMNRVLLKQANIIGYRFGETSRRYPEEKAEIWNELWPLMESGKVQPTVFDEREYSGLQSVPQALEDIASRKVWGKAVIRLSGAEEDNQNRKAML